MSEEIICDILGKIGIEICGNAKKIIRKHKNSRTEGGWPSYKIVGYAAKCGKAGLPDEELRWVSVPLYNGIHRWYKRFDKELIQSMNKPSMKYFPHSGVRYNFLLKIYDFYFK